MVLHVTNISLQLETIIQEFLQVFGYQPLIERLLH